MTAALICEGCGRPPAERDVHCPACGRELPGRRDEAEAREFDPAPRGWLLAAGARGEGSVFEPMPMVTLTMPDGPGWRVRTASAPAIVPSAPVEAPVSTVAPLPAPSQASPSATGTATVAAPAADLRPLRRLYAPLLALVLLSSAGAITLLALHVLLHR